MSDGIAVDGQGLVLVLITHHEEDVFGAALRRRGRAQIQRERAGSDTEKFLARKGGHDRII